MFRVTRQHSHLGLIIVSLVCVSCGSYRPESFESKMAHYNSEEQKTNQVPPLALNFEEGKTRAPSSVVTPAKTNKKTESTELSALAALSNKKLYFLALFDQYNNLARYTPSTTAKIKSCPNFHSGIIEQLGEYPDPNHFKTPIRSEEFGTLKTHLGLQLPMQKNDFHPTVTEFYSSTKNQNLYELQVKALDVHLSKMYDELTELCEYGTSDNYYIFENLTTYIQTQKLTMSNDNLKILMRTTLFTNQVLTNTFERMSEKGRKPAAGQAQPFYFDSVVKRLKVEWAVSFVNPASGPENSHQAN